MIIKIFLSLTFVLSLVSCDTTSTRDKPKEDTPKALSDKPSYLQEISKRGDDDLVEGLYDEVVSKDIDLKKLEDEIGELKRSKNDTTDQFVRFNVKNQSYFRSADKHMIAISDSALRGKMKVLIAKNIGRYDSMIVRHKELLGIIETNQGEISDLHHVLKIITTLPLITKYQSDNLPGTQSLEGYIKQQEKIRTRLDTLSKK